MSLHREFLTANLFINIKKYIPWSSGFKNSEFLTHGAWRSRSLVVFDVGFELIILSQSIFSFMSVKKNRIGTGQQKRSSLLKAFMSVMVDPIHSVTENVLC